jgi:hypothetical protein
MVIFHSKLTIALAAFSRRNLEMMCLCGWLVDGGVFLKLDNGATILSKPGMNLPSGNQTPSCHRFFAALFDG